MQNAEINDCLSQLGELLKQKQMTVTTAESCTGGGIASAITSVSGSSEWFHSGYVTYSNLAKQKTLGVSDKLLEQYGAVSEPVVLSMLEGAIRASGSNIGVAVSGIAGPTGAVPGKPVGTVCFAWGSADEKKASTELFLGDREAVRNQSVEYAIKRLIEYMGS